MKNYILAFISLFIGVCPICQAQDTMISEEVKDNIKSRVENGINTGIVVGVISSNGITYYSYGVKSLETNDVVDENSVFEIGSISKTFTGILLADMVIKGDLNLDDPLQDLLPDGVTAPTRNGEAIKLFHLSNHTSSLPRLPDNMSPANPANPYADYSEKQLYDFLNGYELIRDIGSKYEYSNYAAGLLGHVLASKLKMTYEELMVEVIAKPLGMENTRVVFTPQMKKNLAMGHNNGLEVENWDLPTVAGAGAIRSTAVDMLKYLATNMGLEKSRLYPAMQLAHKDSGSGDSNPIVGLGWHTLDKDGMEIIWHNGGTGGYSTFTGFIKSGNRGVVVLSNSNAGVDDIGIHLLQPTAALDNPKPSIATKIKSLFEAEGIETAIKTYWELKKNRGDEYNFGENELNTLGYYFLGKEEIEKAIAVFKINVQAYPISSNAYDSYGEAMMKNNENEKAIANYKKSVELNPGNSNGIEMLKKLGVATESLTKEVSVEDAVLESYVGNYELAPGFVLTVTKYDNQLKAQATGQEENPIFPKSQNVFYLKVVEAQLTFNKNEAGEVESVTLLQGGQEIKGKKLVD
ncbi:CubicO group peptidase, beta-lactamase class C family [Flavobacteriaceae bacterium MAR_2010_188]|nr:CubicO group peptidase, beta-lactamase class C family [Flavobacteriaceae bacterium MAR_2010_188]